MKQQASMLPHVALLACFHAYSNIARHR